MRKWATYFRRSQNDTKQIIELTKQKQTVSDQIHALLVRIYKKDPYLDFIFYLKRYATQEKEIQHIIDTIDKERMDYVTQLLQSIGYTEREARIKSSLLYKHLIGYHELIRYKTQSKNYIEEVKLELSEFIKF